MKALDLYDLALIFKVTGELNRLNINQKDLVCKIHRKRTEHWS